MYSILTVLLCILNKTKSFYWCAVAQPTNHTLTIAYFWTKFLNIFFSVSRINETVKRRCFRTLTLKEWNLIMRCFFVIWQNSTVNAIALLNQNYVNELDLLACNKEVFRFYFFFGGGGVLFRWLQGSLNKIYFVNLSLFYICCTLY